MFKNEEIPLSSLPGIAALNFKPIHPRYLTVLILQHMLQYSVIACLLIVAKMYLDIEPLEQHFVFICILLVGSIALHFTSSVLGFWKRKYSLRNHDISFKKGLLRSSLATVPLSRIQHLDISQGLLSQKFGLANLKLYTAGDSGSDMVIKGLLLEEAEKIRGYITAQINERV
ncbi:PH domain-containing protein [Spongiimicrobium salis]|uniref:PH domain-containing protein n=1 Tax=Spongiimicrobium salis TaxID=1667022 RepID=UPI00374D4E79